MAIDLTIINQQYKENYIDILGDNLSALRAKAGFTQEEVATMVGVSRQTYYSIETGKRNMTWTLCLALILLFDTNLDTHNMLRGIGAYPKEIIMKMNGNDL